MGIIEKQTIKGSIYSYLGVGIGFLTVGIIWPKVLLPEEIGLINLLIALSALLAHFGSLGINSVANRLFPYFRNEEKGHNGFLFLSFIFGIVGFILVMVFFLLQKELISRFSCTVFPADGISFSPPFFQT